MSFPLTHSNSINCCQEWRGILWSLQSPAILQQSFLFQRRTQKVYCVQPPPNGFSLLESKGCRAAEKVVPTFPSFSHHCSSPRVSSERAPCSLEGTLSSPNPTSASLSEAVFFFLVFHQLFSLLVASLVLSSCYLFRHSCAGSVLICW